MLTSFSGCALDFPVSTHDLDERKMYDPWDVSFDKSPGSLVFDIILEYWEKLIKVGEVSGTKTMRSLEADFQRILCGIPYLKHALF